MPIAEHPTLDELIWLFEADPVLAEPGLDWPISAASWTTIRGPWEVKVTIGVFDRDVYIEGALAGVTAISVNLMGIVERLSVDRAHGQEALVVTSIDGADLHPVRLVLKPHVRVDVLNRLPWERTTR
jgi:hypothetical protein